tara:strand:- start:540 stop:1079 length:540 start_codon:yes stop_codon:yes gene_type:complete
VKKSLRNFKKKMNFIKHFKEKSILPLTQKNNYIYLLIIASIFFLDRYSKIKIIKNQSSENVIYLNDFINLDLVWNTGIGFGLFSSNSNIIYNSITALIGSIIIFLIFLIIKSKNIDKFFFSVILGGALGNFYDRIIYYAVPDFIDIHYQKFHWFTFNIADIFITIGIITLIINDFFKNE